MIAHHVPPYVNLLCLVALEFYICFSIATCTNGFFDLNLLTLSSGLLSMKNYYFSEMKMLNEIFVDSNYHILFSLSRVLQVTYGCPIPS